MFLEHREKEENKRQATAGYDLTDAYAQISYCLPGEPCPKTISLQADQEQYLIPALLGRYTDQDLWVYGPKAQAAAAAGEVFLVDGLLTKAAHQEMVEVGGQNYSSVALLSLFLKRTMSLLAPIVRPERLQALVFSVPEVSVPILSAVTDASIGSSSGFFMPRCTAATLKVCGSARMFGFSPTNFFFASSSASSKVALVFNPIPLA